MDLSIVATMYYSAPYLEEFYIRIKNEAEKITDDFEIIFVNDGSPDNSLDITLSLYETDNRIRIIDLSRNFGHHKAMMTGLAHAKGELVFLIDCDLEEEPELLNRFFAEINNTEADVVYGIQGTRKGGLFERVSGDVFWRLFNLLSEYYVPSNQLVARLMTRRYVASLVAHKDREVFMPGLWTITGFKQTPVIVKKQSKGSSTYTFRKKITQFIDAITSFSSTPLVFSFYFGAVIVLISGSAALYLIVRRIFFGIYLAGWPSLIVSIWLLGGLTIFSLGVIGIYLSRIFVEVKQRPFTVIRNHFDQHKEIRHELQSKARPTLDNSATREPRDLLPEAISEISVPE